MTTGDELPRPVSPITQAATSFVEAHRNEAARLGHELGDLVDDPEQFVVAVRAGLDHLVDVTYQREQARVAPGLADSSGVRLPLLTALRRAFDRESRWAGPDSLLWLAGRLLREPGLEIRVIAFGLLARVLPDDPERSWQVLRRAARDAHDWITVDTLAHAYGLGILLEPFRWSEIEQLAFSSSPWERRLVGSTIATIPFIRRGPGRQPEIAARALPIVANLLGDADPDVQKALSWALRSMARVDAIALANFIEQQSIVTARLNDGHRAWVLRDALPALQPADAERIQARLTGIRRRPGASSTSDASDMADRFRGLVDETPRVDGRRSSTSSPDASGVTA